MNLALIQHIIPQIPIMRDRFALVLFFCSLIQIQTLSCQSERSVIQAFNAKGIEQVILDLPGELEILAAPGELIQIETAISLQNAGAPILKALIHAMRYSLATERNGSDLHIKPENRLSPVTVRGLEIQESFHFRVYLPVGVQVAVSDPSLSQNGPDSQDPHMISK